MIISVDTGSAVPVFEQVRMQITRLVASGQLPPGSKLPPIRQLASDLGLARGTVNKVYDLLARDGVVAMSGRHGTVVLDTPLVSTTADAEAAADALALVARQLGTSDAQVHKLLDEALERTRKTFR